MLGKGPVISKGSPAYDAREVRVSSALHGAKVVVDVPLSGGHVGEALTADGTKTPSGCCF